ncbi:chemokine C-C motif receptor-like 2 [Pteropus vampyrus]|uniref:Chemokine C-C motif receptor-like 2 n=1 Tax=Pteropus vampyrus TaxID=132908 RepID=A0A6P6C625_PTEVA|nr:chemokine C-C motif receptor-like 2 [Pteropus vampyrus]
MLVALPEFLFYQPQTGSQEPECFFSRLHFLPGNETFWKYFLTLRMNIVGLLVPLSVFIVCYVRMRKTPRSRGTNRDLLKLVFAITFVFLLMWGPYATTLFLSTFKDYFPLRGCKGGYALDRSVQVTRIIATTHCCVNALLYVLLDQAFWRRLCGPCHPCGHAPLPPAEDAAEDAAWAEHHRATAV